MAKLFIHSYIYRYFELNHLCLKNLTSWHTCVEVPVKISTFDVFVEMPINEHAKKMNEMSKGEAKDNLTILCAFRLIQETAYISSGQVEFIS